MDEPVKPVCPNCSIPINPVDLDTDFYLSLGRTARCPHCHALLEECCDETEEVVGYRLVNEPE